MATPTQLGPTHFTITLSGSAQRLSDALAVVSSAGQGLDMEPKIRALVLQADGANAAAVCVGCSSAVTTADFGFSLPAGAGGVPAAPYTLGPFEGAQLSLSNLWVIGTNGQKLHLTLIPWMG